MMRYAQEWIHTRGSILGNKTSQTIPRSSVDVRWLSLCQDPYLRARIMPVFRFDPKALNLRPHGHGTAFRIDPWGTCATAFHVIEDLLRIEGDTAALRDDIRLAALQLEEVIYGEAHLPEGSWRPFSGIASVCGIESGPLGTPVVRNVTELAALSVRRSPTTEGDIPYLPLDIGRWRPQKGDTVLAFGFADLDVDHHCEGEDRPIRQYLYGSEAEIIEVQPADPRSSRPWPVFRVGANWPGGMSGGPVFSQEGKVIGLVSTGIIGAGIGTVTYFSGWDFAERTFVSLDGSNPGWFRCWGTFDDQNQLKGITLARENLETDADRSSDVRQITANPITGDYICL